LQEHELSEKRRAKRNYVTIADFVERVFVKTKRGTRIVHEKGRL
jgi:hypothetical protein